MVANFYTLRALVHEWQPRVSGCRLVEAFSQEPDELTLALASSDREMMFRIGTRAPLRFVFRMDGYSRARRNVATLFSEAHGRRVETLSIADRDRIVFFALEGGLVFHIMLFGPRANVFLADEEGIVLEAFHDDAEWNGRRAPEPRPAARVGDFASLLQRWRADRRSVEQAVASAFPLFDRTLAAEVAFRAGVDGNADPDLPEDDCRALFASAEEVIREVDHPTPRIYWEEERPVRFAPIRLHHLGALREEAFDTVDDGVRVYVRRKLARRRFDELFDPMEKALAQAAGHYRSSVEKMLEELSGESRADRYEKWGHLLMAAGSSVSAGAEAVDLADLFEQGETVRIPLDPSLSAVENAERYYDKARRTRRSREEAEKRLIETERLADAAEALLAKLRASPSVRDVEAFRKSHADELGEFMTDDAAPGDRIPFRRFELPNGYEVWVGRNARQNDELTSRYARKFDLWMHARGVAGSHAVLRLPSRQAQPGRPIVEQAASIAAYFSKARGSSLVPVVVAERKYVRKPKGASPGTVVIEREEVLLVEPRLPN